MPSSSRPDDRLASVFRFATELVAWIATPWALASRSVPVTVLAAITVVLELPRWRWLAFR